MALVTFKSSSRLISGTLVESNSRGFQVHMDEPENLGGTNTAMNPVELLLASLGGCMSIVASAFAEQNGVKLDGVRVDVEGDLDPGGFLGTNPDARMGYEQIRATVTIESSSPRENIDRLMKVIEERCPVHDTLCGVDVHTNLVVGQHVSTKAA